MASEKSSPPIFAPESLPMRSIAARGTLLSTKIAFTPFCLMKSTTFAMSASPASVTVETPWTPTTWKP